jgi:hypothetical protein
LEAGLSSEDSRAGLVGADPIPWILASEESAARWVALTRVLERPAHDADVVAAHEAVLADPGTSGLLDRIPDWENPGPLSGHESPSFAPNLLAVLADMGVREADDERIGRILDRMLEHQDDDGRFCACAEWKRLPDPRWGALLCDAHAIAETLARFGRLGDPRLDAAFEAMAVDVQPTAQGRAWPCRPDDLVGFRGPGRKGDFCPQVTLEALRAFSYLPDARRPVWLEDVVSVSLRAWLERGAERPYMFGHGRQFKRGKWPVTWYNALSVLDAVGRYPRAWLPPEAPEMNTRAVVELAACVIAYDLDADTGRATPHSCFKGFETYSFGQKKTPSAFVTARILSVLVPFAPLARQIAGVDVMALGSSKGGSGVPMAP